MKSASHAVKSAFVRPLTACLTAGLFLLPAITQAQEKLTVRLDLNPWGIHGAMHLAKEKKWFADEGLDVDVQDGTGSIAALQMVAAGHVEVGQVQLGTMAIAKQGGLNLISIAGWARKGDLAVMVDRKSSMNNAKDLKGKNLVTFASSPWVQFVKPYMKFVGDEQAKVMMVAPTAMITTYATGAADGFMSLGPFGIPLTEKTRPSKALLLSESGVSFPSYGLVTTPEVLKEKQGSLQKLVRIQQRAWTYIYNGHVDEAVAAIISQRPGTKLDPEVLKSQIEMYRPFFDSPSGKRLPYGVQSIEDWENALASMAKVGALAAPLKPESYFTNSLFER